MTHVEAHPVSGGESYCGGNGVSLGLAQQSLRFLQPRQGETNDEHVYTVTIDCTDPRRLAEFWSKVLSYEVAYDGEDGDEVAIEPAGSDCPAVLFIRVPEPKAVKNRIHLDLNPDDQEKEVRRLEQLGASRVDIGQGDVTWVVLADPEGNEFCVLTPRQD